MGTRNIGRKEQISWISTRMCKLLKSFELTSKAVARMPPKRGLMKELLMLLRLMNRANMVPSIFLGMIHACMTRVGMMTKA